MDINSRLRAAGRGERAESQESFSGNQDGFIVRGRNRWSESH